MNEKQLVHISELIMSHKRLILKNKVNNLENFKISLLSFDRIYDEETYEYFDSYYKNSVEGCNKYEKRLATKGIYNERIYCLSVEIHNISCKIESLYDSSFSIANDSGYLFKGHQIKESYLKKRKIFSTDVPSNYKGYFNFYYIVPDDDFEYMFVLDNENENNIWEYTTLDTVPLLKGHLDKSENLNLAIENGMIYSYSSFDCIWNNDDFRIQEIITTLRIVSFRPSTDEEIKLMYRNKYGHSFINDKEILNSVSLYTMEIIPYTPPNRKEYAIKECPISIYDDYENVYRGYNIYMYNNNDKRIETYVFALPIKDLDYYVLCFKDNKVVSDYFENNYLEKIMPSKL